MDSQRCLQTLLRCLDELARPPAASDTLSLARQYEELATQLRKAAGISVQECIATAHDVAPQYQRCPVDVSVLASDKKSNAEEDQDVHWRYVRAVLDIINATCIHAAAIAAVGIPSSTGLLGMKDTLALQQSTLVIGVWGIAPCLDHAVGLPYKDRLGESLTNKLPIFNATPPPSSMSVQVKAARLQYISWVLGPCILSTTEISNTLRTHLLGDFVMALCQITYAPSCREITQAPVRAAAAGLLHAACIHVSADLTLESFSVPLARAACPDWLRRACGRYLSICLCRPGGVHALLKQLLDAALTDDTVAAVAERAAQVVGTYPGWMKVKEAYFAPVCAQLRTLMHLKTATRDEQARKIAYTVLVIIYKLLDTEPGFTQRFLLANGICKVLVGGRCHGGVVDAGQAVQYCVEDLHRLFVAGPRMIPTCSSASAHIALLAPYIPALFQLHCFVRGTASGLQTSCQELLATYLRSAASDEAVSLLLSFVLPGRSPDIKVAFEYGAEGSVAVNDAGQFVWDVAKAAQGIADVLALLKQTSVPGDYFVALVDELTRVADEADDKALAAMPTGAKPLRNILEPGLEAGPSDTVGDRYLSVLQSTLMLVEKLGVAILRRPTHVVRFAKLVASSTDGETVAMALGLLTAMFSGAVMIGEEDEVEVAALHGWLEGYMHHPDPQVREMAADLRTTIRTRDPSWQTLNQQPPCEPEPEPEPGNVSVKVTDTPTKPSEPPSQAQSAGEVAEMKETLATALADLRDTMLPVRAHGLITLRRLVREKDPTIMSHIDKIRDILDGNLRQSDSYLYLNAIHGMAELACGFPAVTLPHIAGAMENPALSVDVRVKYAEVVSNVIEQCPPNILGSYVPDIASRLLRMLEMNAADARSEAPIHASAFAALAMLCQVHGGAMRPHVKAIVLCVNEALQVYMDESQVRPLVMEMSSPSAPSPHTPDPSACTPEDAQEVRRGAMHVLTLLFRGLGNDTIRVMAPYLKSTLQQVRRTAASDVDDTTRAHAQVALDELDAIVENVFGLRRIQHDHPNNELT